MDEYLVPALRRRDEAEAAFVVPLDQRSVEAHRYQIRRLNQGAHLSASGLNAGVGINAAWIADLSGIALTCQRIILIPAAAKALSFFASAAWRSGF